MNKTFLLALAAALIGAPAALAHDPVGTPKNYCEDPSEWNVHDYGPPATGRAIFTLQDGNLAGDCDGSGGNLDLVYCLPEPIPGSACDQCDDPNPPQICQILTPVADFDGHLEWALGGAWILVDSGDGVTSGSIVCYGAVGDHVAFGPISVVDAVLGTTVAYRVAADRVNLVPPTDPAAPDCGDFQTDESAICPSSPCTVDFLPGLDGAYKVFVGDVPNGGLPGTVGHIVWP